MTRQCQASLTVFMENPSQVSFLWFNSSYSEIRMNLILINILQLSLLKKAVWLKFCWYQGEVHRRERKGESTYSPTITVGTKFNRQDCRVLWCLLLKKKHFQNQQNLAQLQEETQTLSFIVLICVIFLPPIAVTTTKLGRYSYHCYYYYYYYYYYNIMII